MTIGKRPNKKKNLTHQQTTVCFFFIELKVFVKNTPRIL